MKKIMIFMLVTIYSINLSASQNTYIRRKWTLNQLLDMNGFNEDERPRFEIPYQSASPERVSSFPVNICLEHHDDYYMPALSKSELISLVSSSSISASSHAKKPTKVIFMDYSTEFDNHGNMKNISCSSIHWNNPQNSTGKFKEPVYELTELGKYLVSQISVGVVSCNNHAQEEEID